jgi:DNA-binding NarL/FixJ family response regulator
MEEPIRLVFVDDEPRLRASWARIIRDEVDMTLVESLESADQLTSNLPREDSVVILDLSMPGRNPLDTVAEIREAHPQCRVIIYSGYNDPDTVREALMSGAWGFVDKLTPPLKILDAIRRVARGEAVFPPGFTG